MHQEPSHLLQWWVGNSFKGNEPGWNSWFSRICAKQPSVLKMADIVFSRLCLNFLDVDNRNNVLRCISGRRRCKFNKSLAIWVSSHWSLLAWSSPAGLPIPLSLLYCGKCCLTVRQLVYENTIAQQAMLLVLGYWTALLLCPEWVSENPKHLRKSSKLSRSDKLEAGYCKRFKRWNFEL